VNVEKPESLELEVVGLVELGGGAVEVGGGGVWVGLLDIASRIAVFRVFAGAFDAETFCLVSFLSPGATGVVSRADGGRAG
jgi:hypothetical protein